MPIYEIDDEIRRIFDEATDPETGEVSEDAFEALEQLQMERDRKVDNVACWYKNLVAEAEAIKAEERKLKARREVIEREAERRKNYLEFVLHGEKFSSPRSAVSFRKSKKCIIDDINLLDEKFLTYAEPTPNKKEITDAIKSGEEVRGAHLEENTSVIIK